MAENDQQVHPIPSNQSDKQAQSKTDVEAATTTQARELRRQKRRKCLIYIAAFAVFQIAVIAIFSLTVMKIRNPKYRVRSATLDTSGVTTSNDAAFKLTMNARLGVKNMNFGKYKFDASTVDFYYGDVVIGSAVVPSSEVGWLSHKKFNVVAELSSAGVQAGANSKLAADISSGVLPLTARSRLTGKVKLTFIFKKKKNTQMNCSMEANLSTKQIQNVKC